jgi:hypothetical protein
MLARLIRWWRKRRDYARLREAMEYTDARRRATEAWRNRS